MKELDEYLLIIAIGRLSDVKFDLGVKEFEFSKILLPEGECLHGSGCSDVRNFDKYDIISLCDTNRVAWNAYGQPKPNTVILVDPFSKIVEIQNTDNLKKLAEKTYWMARNLYD